jgi:hypothetical protein
MAISDDYDGDGLPDLYLFSNRKYTGNNDIKSYRIYKGTDGTLLFSKSITLGNLGYSNTKLTLADMNHDGKDDFISNLQGLVEVYNPYTNTSLFNRTLSSGYVIPSDLNFDGTQDLIHSVSGRTYVFFSNYTNQNPTISSVTYDPSTSVTLSQPINAIVSAYDVESDTKIYGVKCSDTDSFVGDSGTPTQTCTYAVAGVYNLSVGVRDIYHTTYNLYSHSIYVSSTGALCGDGVCNGIETFSTCPADCTEEGGTIGGENGTTTLPLDIVDVNDTDSGLLPTIYYGLMGFLSYALVPVVSFLFIIFIALIIFAIGRIFKNMVHT